MQKEKFRFPFKLLDPWQELEFDEGKLEAELKREVREDGTLHGVTSKAIAWRKDCDDVLFEIEAKEAKYAVVHLTWSGSRDPHPGFPETHLYSSLDDWRDRCMIPEHEDYTSE